MGDFGTFGDVHVTLDDDFVATAEIRRPPNNFFDLDLIDWIGDALRAVDADPDARAVVLCSQGKHFCAGADFGGRGSAPAEPKTNADGSPRHLYDSGLDLFSTRTPVVAAVQGAAIGGGLGLACFADFRVAASEARFSANFARLGFHHGFGLSMTLPRLVGEQRALELLYTGRRITGDEAHALGLADRNLLLDLPAHHAGAAVEAEQIALVSLDEVLAQGDSDTRWLAFAFPQLVDEAQLQFAFGAGVDHDLREAAL